MRKIQNHEQNVSYKNCKIKSLFLDIQKFEIAKKVRIMQKLLRSMRIKAKQANK